MGLAWEVAAEQLELLDDRHAAATAAQLDEQALLMTMSLPASFPNVGTPAHDVQLLCLRGMRGSRLAAAPTPCAAMATADFPTVGTPGMAYAVVQAVRGAALQCPVRHVVDDMEDDLP